VTRIAVVIVITIFAFAALLVLAGRTDWYAVSYDVASGAIDAVTADDNSDSDAGAATATLSDPSSWNRDFMRGARSSPECAVDTVRNIQMRMAAIGPYTLEEFVRTVAFYASTGDDRDQGAPTYNRVSDDVRSSITAADRIYAFGLNSSTVDSGGWQVSGYFVARGDCLVHVEVTGFDN